MTQQRYTELTTECWTTDDSDVRVPFDPASESVYETVALTVGTLLDTAPMRVPTLCDVVDPDALDALFHDPGGQGGPTTECTVGFRYAGYLVRVYSAGHITFTRLDGREDAPRETSAESSTG